MRVFRFFLLAALISVGACSSSADSADDSSADDVATLDGAENDQANDDASVDADASGNDVADDDDSGIVVEETPQTMSPEESSLAFSQCMRDEGVDFPDLGVDASGNIDLNDLPADFDGQDPDVQDAFTQCQSILDAGGFGERIRETIESDEFEQALIDFSGCVRDQGFDVGDLTLTSLASAAFQTPPPSDDEPQTADREAGFGDSGGIFARALGLDPDDPEVEAAIETCVPIMEGAMSGLGLG